MRDARSQALADGVLIARVLLRHGAVNSERGAVLLARQAADGIGWRESEKFWNGVLKEVILAGYAAQAAARRLLGDDKDANALIRCGAHNHSCNQETI